MAVVTCLAVIPPELGKDNFGLPAKILYVPAGSVEVYIIGKTKCDGIQNQMRLFGGRVSPKRKATKISHTHTKKHRSNGF